MPTLMLVPTGIGCDIGGYAGDALPSARLLAAASGCLITHPNVMNGASLYWSDSSVLYVEGYGLDRFAVGDWALRPVRRQRIGLLLDAGIEPELAQRQIQVAEGCRASLGLEIGPRESHTQQAVALLLKITLHAHGIGLFNTARADHRSTSGAHPGAAGAREGDASSLSSIQHRLVLSLIHISEPTRPY